MVLESSFSLVIVKEVQKLFIYCTYIYIHTHTHITVCKIGVMSNLLLGMTNSILQVV